MANIEEIPGVFGGVQTDEVGGTNENVTAAALPATTGFWNKVKSVLFYEIKVELTPYQQKIEDEINEFLYQEITWAKVKDFLFQEVTFGKKKGND